MIWHIILAILIGMLYMNIGIIWVLHIGEVDWDMDEKIKAQVHMILWPVSIMLYIGWMITKSQFIRNFFR
jgi:hypothetical protein